MTRKLPYDDLADERAQVLARAKRRAQRGRAPSLWTVLKLVALGAFVAGFVAWLVLS